MCPFCRSCFQNKKGGQKLKSTSFARSTMNPSPVASNTQHLNALLFSKRRLYCSLSLAGKFLFFSVMLQALCILIFLPGWLRCSLLVSYHFRVPSFAKMSLRQMLWSKLSKAPSVYLDRYSVLLKMRLMHFIMTCILNIWDCLSSVSSGLQLPASLS